MAKLYILETIFISTCTVTSRANAADCIASESRPHNARGVEVYDLTLAAPVMGCRHLQWNKK